METSTNVHKLRSLDAVDLSKRAITRKTIDAAVNCTGFWFPENWLSITYLASELPGKSWWRRLMILWDHTSVRPA